MLEFVEIKNLPEGLKGSVYVSFSKTQPDVIFNTKRKLNIYSEYGEKQVALFNCQPTGHLLFEVFVHSKSNLPKSKPKALGSTSISLEDYLVPVSSLSVEKWLEVVPLPGFVNSDPICIRAAISFIIPSPATRVLHMVRSRPFLKGSCFSPLPEVKFAKSWTHITDETGNELISLQMRYLYTCTTFHNFLCFDFNLMNVFEIDYYSVITWIEGLLLNIMVTLARRELYNTDFCFQNLFL